MSKKETNSLENLPVELIYKILNYVDSLTIVRNIRCVSKRFYELVNGYNEHRFHFQSISQSNFLFLLNYVEHENIVSLTLSDNDQTPEQIQLFLSLFRLYQFNQLRFLEIEEIDECYVNLILKDIHKLKLYSLKISSKKNYSQNQIDFNRLSSIMSLSTLSKFSWNIPQLNFNFFIWPQSTNLKELEMNCFHFEEYLNIVQHFTNLEKLVLIGFNEFYHEERIYSDDQLKRLNHLKCLTMKNGNMDLFILKKVLHFCPSLIKLQLIESMDLFLFISQIDQLEKYFQNNLIMLNEFELFLQGNSDSFLNSSISIDSIINHFQTSYWIEMKQWCFQCIHIQSHNLIILFTPPFFNENFSCFYKPKEVIHYQSKGTTINKYLITHQMKSIEIDLESVMSCVTSKQGGLPNEIVYPCIEHLFLRVEYQWPQSSLRFLTSLIAFSNLSKLSLSLEYHFNRNYLFYQQLNLCLKQIFSLSKKLHSFSFSSSTDYLDYLLKNRIELCSIIPSNIKHLKMSISRSDQMDMIINQLKHLTSIHFTYFTFQDSSDLFVQWLKHHPTYQTYTINQSSLLLWIHNRF